jgi:hypothetical protein
MTDLLTAGGLILTVLLAYMQIQRTHRRNLEAQEAHLRNQLKVDLYEKAAAVFQAAADAANRASSDYRATLSVLELQAKGFPFAHSQTSADLLDSEKAASRALIAVLIFLEQHEIAFARFRDIRRALSETHENLLDSHNKLWMKLVQLIPPPPQPDGRATPPLALPNAQNVEDARVLYETFSQACSDICSYLIDLQIEAQNELLGDLFQRQLPPRHPADPALRVLTRDAAVQTTRPRGRLI